MTERDYRRDAIRLFFIIVAGSTEFRDSAFPDYDAVFQGESRLQALDFWVRYPDYLGDEMLSQHEQSSDPAKLATVRKIFDDDEPSLRRLPMLRKYFGAYEPLDTSLGILKSRGLVLPRSKASVAGTASHDFLVGGFARQKHSDILRAFPTLDWYRARAELVVQIARGRGGFELKKRQHAQKEYHEAQSGDLIPTIALRVQKRLVMMEEQL
ncbi:hypothetical protein [Rhizobium lusitanum]|jgi:hypothetical protein|uniref:hypothetical protein n=1 Tax=Rhizobium lusitanum TaxID=293958 RepID=UPI000DDE99E1|nr:hypothetical protein [Rhizobium lusitanum]NTJ08237.1 hypothetical protein [Rhizobium lusitanum]